MLRTTFTNSNKKTMPKLSINSIVQFTHCKGKETTFYQDKKNCNIFSIPKIKSIPKKAPLKPPSINTILTHILTKFLPSNTKSPSSTHKSPVSINLTLNSKSKSTHLHNKILKSVTYKTPLKPNTSKT
jgi:hypothetical protein